LRVDPFAGPFSGNDERIAAIAALARERVAEARARGIEPAELQIDFDCAEAKLDGYRLWLRALREAVRPLPVCPTALPSWLKRREFAAFARESGRFVLQVHCVEPPRELATLGKLTDPARAAAWVEQAGRLGVPFRGGAYRGQSVNNVIWGGHPQGRDCHFLPDRLLLITLFTD